MQSAYGRPAPPPDRDLTCVEPGSRGELQRRFCAWARCIMGVDVKSCPRGRSERLVRPVSDELKDLPCKE
jgi:hypothetical protein